MNSRRFQQGVTLLELIIALMLLTLIISLMSISYDGDRQRAEALLDKTQEVKVALDRFFIDYPCGLTHASGLVRPDHADHSPCGTLNDVTRWNGPYMNPAVELTSITGGNIDLSRIFDGVELALVYEVPDGNPNVIVSAIEMLNVPNHLRSYIEKQCADSCRALNDPSRIAMIVRESPAALQTTDLSRYQITPFGFNP